MGQPLTTKRVLDVGARVALSTAKLRTTGDWSRASAERRGTVTRIYLPFVDVLWDDEDQPLFYLRSALTPSNAVLADAVMGDRDPLVASLL